jgi:hypothetical protein
MLNQDIILIILISAVLYLLYKTSSNKENFTVNDDVKQAINDIYKADINAIRNLSNVATDIYNNDDSFTIPAKTTNVGDLVTKNIASTNITISGNINTDGNINSNGAISSKNINSTIDITAGGDIMSNSSVKSKTSLCIDDFCIDKNTLKKALSNIVFAGFGINGNNVSYTPFYEGTWLLHGNINDNISRFSFGSSDTIDVIGVNKGWKITVYKHGPDDVNPENAKVLENKTDNLPKTFQINGLPGWTDAISSYKAEWVGY